MKNNDIKPNFLKIKELGFDTKINWNLSPERLEDICLSKGIAKKTNLGAILRAGIENRDMVKVLGINVNVVFLYTFGLGAYLAGLAGALSAPIMGLTPSMGLDILPICFVVVVVAGLGSIPGAIIAGILIGLSQGAATIWYPEATNVVIYVMMGLTIIFRPQGLFGVR